MKGLGKIKVLAVDDSPGILEAMERVFSRDGMDFIRAGDGAAALQLVESEQPDLIFLDVVLPGMSGLDVLVKVRDRFPQTPVIVITGHGSMQTAIEAIKHGAFDYITKPLHLDTLRMVTRRAVDAAGRRDEAYDHRSTVAGPSADAGLIGNHPSMQQIYKKIGIICTTPNSANVLIIGESGTGKELVARAIHANGPNPGAPFVAINCTVLPEALLESELFGHEKGAFTGADFRKPGKFEAAGAGTILLDEIGDMPEALQKKLLRVIQERAFERLGGNNLIALQARIIAATHHDILGAVKRGEFREDLYYRLNVFELQLPPLRERQDDIESLAYHFVDKYNKKFGRQFRYIEPAVMDALLRYRFPGNVRELENMIARAIALERGEILRAESFSPKIFTPQAAENLDIPIVAEDFAGAKQAVIEAFEKKFLTQRLTETHGNVTEAAHLSGLERQSFQRLMKKYGIASEDFKAH